MRNNHCIREAECPGGKPDVLYYTPSHLGGIECKLPLSRTDLESFKQNIEYPDFPGYTPATGNSWNCDGWAEHQSSR